MEDEKSHKIRQAAFDWLQQQAPVNDFIIDWKDLTKGFVYEGNIVPLIGAKGIWKPAIIKEYPISVTSVQESIYDDGFISDDTMFYSYRGKDPNHNDNVGLRNTKQNTIPLIYFHQILKGKYFVAWPVFVVGDEPEKLRFTISAESKDVLTNSNLLNEPSAEYRRSYQTREVVVRLHQGVFRERVLQAYRNHCAICKLKHRVLLDAAHIIPDSQGGRPEVPNGLSLCKIHHAALIKI